MSAVIGDPVASGPCCCGTCPQVTCSLCTGGTGPAVFEFRWDNFGSAYQPVIIWGGLLVPPFGIVIVNWPNSSFELNATGSCVWEGVFASDPGSGHPTFTAWCLYIKLFYSSGWKVLFDYFTFTALPVLADYTPSGFAITFSLNTSLDCCATNQTIGITQFDGPADPLFLVDSWHGPDASTLQNAIPTSITLDSCGCSGTLVGGAVAETKSLARPVRCLYVLKRSEFVQGCNGIYCLHDCELGLPAVPGGYCQTCTSYVEDAGPWV